MNSINLLRMKNFRQMKLMNGRREKNSNFECCWWLRKLLIQLDSIFFFSILSFPIYSNQSIRPLHLFDKTMCKWVALVSSLISISPYLRVLKRLRFRIFHWSNRFKTISFKRISILFLLFKTYSHSQSKRCTFLFISFRFHKKNFREWIW